MKSKYRGTLAGQIIKRWVHHHLNHKPEKTLADTFRNLRNSPDMKILIQEGVYGQKTNGWNIYRFMIEEKKAQKAGSTLC